MHAGCPRAGDNVSTDAVLSGTPNLTRTPVRGSREGMPTLRPRHVFPGGKGVSAGEELFPMAKLTKNSETSSESGYKTFFYVAAAYNLGMGLIFFLFFSRLMALFAMPLPPRELVAFHQLGIVLAMVFGIGYYMVARDLYSHTGIVLLGAIGKISVFFIFLYHLLFSGLAFMIFLAGVGDLIFSIFFIRFLFFARNRAGA